MASNSKIDEAVAKSRRDNGIPDQLPESDIHTLDDLFHHAVSTYGDKPAYQCIGQQISFRDLDQLSDQFAVFLQNELQLPPGTHLALHMPNLLQYPVSAMGALKAGLILVNTNPLYTDEELEHQFNDAEVEVVVTLANIAGQLQELAKKIPDLKVIVTEVADIHPPLKRILINGVLKFVRKEVPSLQFANSYRFRQALKIGRSGEYERFKPHRNDIALLQYTGGTTGPAKGAMLTHGSLTDCMHQCEWLYEAAGMVKGEMTVIEPLPLYHIYAFSTGFTHNLMQGSRTVLITNPRDLDRFVDEMIKVPCNGLFGLNTLFNALLNHPKFDQIDFSGAKLCVSGGMPLSAALAQRWKERTGVQISEGYGLTESSGILSFNPPSRTRSGTAGVGFSGCEFKIEGDNGEALGVGEQGELLFKGPQMMLGYWKRPDATQELLDDDGYMRTGDVARFDEDGYITICDRKKDMIIVSGFKIFPSEVEDVVMHMEGVREAAVIGETDEMGNEKVVLYVVKADEEVNDERIIAHCREQLTAYKIPKKIVYMDDLPKSNVGKVLRRELRDQVTPS